LADLPAKFCFALDGVGEYQLDTTYADLALRAVAPDASRSVRVRLIVGGEICGEEMPAEQGVEALLDAARAAEGKRLFTRGCSSSDASSSPLAPLGVSEAHRPDLLNLAPSIPLGRVNAEQAFGVAALVRGYGGELRLAPWRGLVLGAMPRAELAEIVEELQGLGLPLDASDGYRGIAACVGIEGCAEALADVRRDAATLARRLAARAQGTACAISLAACPKRCGMRRGVGIEFVARREGYDVFVDGKLALAEISSLRLPQELVDRELSAHDLGDAFEFRLMELQQSKA
jgi:sulfite reductase beta subunit-like hemoprotein